MLSQVSSNLCQVVEIPWMPHKKHFTVFRLYKWDLTPPTMTPINKNSDITHISSKSLKSTGKSLSTDIETTNIAATNVIDKPI